MRVIWAPRAIARAAEIAEYIAADRPNAAERWVDGLFAKAATLGRGRKVPEINRDDVRQLQYGRYRIIYRIDPGRLVILTVRHDRRGWDAAEVEPNA